MGDSIYRKFMIRFNLQDTDDTGFANSVPWQALHQCVKLLIGNRHLCGAPGLRPVELSPVKASGAQPDAESIMDQHLHSVGAFVSKQIRTVRSGTTKDLNDTGQRFIGPGAHIQGFSGQPDLIDPDH